MIAIRLALILSLAQASVLAEPTEAEYNKLFCQSVGGEQETRHDYSYGNGEGYVLVDCETDTMVWEGGLDRRSSLNSVQQALFFAALTGKQPGVVIYDTDGVEDQYEYRIRIAAEIAVVQYESYDRMEGLQEPGVPEVVMPDMPDFSFDYGW